MGSQRVIRAFLFLMVIQLHCEILLAENGGKHSKSDLIIRILPEKSKYLSDSEYDDNLDDYLDYKTQYLDLNSYINRNSIKHLDNEYMSNLKQLSGHKIHRSDPYVTKVPVRSSRSNNEYTANLRQLSDRKMRFPNSDPHVTEVPARKSIFSDNEYAASLRQLSDRKMRYPDSDSHVSEVPARRSQSSNSEYAASLRQLSDRKMRYLDSDPHVTKVPARRSQSSNTEYAASLRQLSDRKMRYLDSDPHVTKVPARRYQSSNSNLDDSDYLEQYSDPSPRLDLSGSFTQSQRRNLEILPRFNSKHSDTIDLTQSSGKRYLHPIAYVLDQDSAKKLQAAQSSSKPSLRTYPDSNNVQQSNTRRFDLGAAVKLAKLGVEGMTLLPQLIFGEVGSPKHYHYDDAKRRLVCTRGTQLVNNRCEPIFYSENGNDARIRKIVRISDINLDRDLDDDDEKKIGDITQISALYKTDRNIGSYYQESGKE
ncbi:uncharacterized protein LOC115241771 [Formica exsecta]|uniref:uncharacterized protein LOC115241771 n=1 Tax=Formica exsecta TaxID=72781 RepID=UPI0011423278|nr:uncharacterized protein LOC115241771 [Formica exsecta]